MAAPITQKHAKNLGLSYINAAYILEYYVRSIKGGEISSTEVLRERNQFR
jgi:hypothetical protein